MFLSSTHLPRNKQLTRLTVIILILLCMGGLSSSVSADTSGIQGNSTVDLCSEETYIYSFSNTSGKVLANFEAVIDLSGLNGFDYVPGSASLDIDYGTPFCQADPVVESGIITWDADNLCSQSIILNPNETLNVQFNLKTGCSAESGNLQAHLNYISTDAPETPLSDNAQPLSIKVLPGSLSISKTPNIIPQEIGQNVTWTLTVKNTGLGTVKNVVIRDELGDGLLYISSTQNGVNDGQITTWSQTEIPALASMAAGDVLTVDITARVVGSQGLVNQADVRWGCDTGETAICQNTETDGGTAYAAVETILKTPLLQFTPSDINLTYCQEEYPFALTLNNIGDGTANDILLYVDLSPYTLDNLSTGVVYNSTEKRFELSDSIPAGSNYELGFTLHQNQWCGTSLTDQELTWKPSYKDNLGTTYSAPVEFSSVNPPSDTPQINLQLTGAPEVVKLGSTLTYTLTSAHSGVSTCASGSCGLSTVVDTVPAGLTVTDAGGGVWIPGGDGTGGTLTWTYTPPETLNTTFTLQLPGEESSASFCGSSITNSVEAAANDCCECSKSAAVSLTTAVTCEKGLDAEKTVSPVPCPKCSDLAYANTFTFDSGNPGYLSGLVFEDFAEQQQQYAPSSLNVIFDGNEITSCVVVTDNTPGGYLNLDFSGCANTPLDGKTLTVNYSLIHDGSGIPVCQGAEFLSWSLLKVNDEEAARPAALVKIAVPAMTLDISGLGKTVSKGESKTITLSLTQTSSSANPKDVQLLLDGDNFIIPDPNGVICNGVSPTDCKPTIDSNGDYIWTFDDGFTGASQNATLQFDVTKACSDSANLTASLYYDDHCSDDTNPDQRCSTHASQTPQLLGGDLQVIIEPEVIYANSSQVEWTIYLINRGSGTAYNVWLDNILGSGLIYFSLVVDDMSGVSLTANQDHEGNAINGASLYITELAAGERRQITLNATLIDANNLTLDVSAAYASAGVSCQTPAADNAAVQPGSPQLRHDIYIQTPVNAGASPGAVITLENTGQTTLYNLQSTVSLPPGLFYRSGTTRWHLSGEAWNGPNAAYEPNPATSPLEWTSTEISGLGVLDPGEKLEIEFSLATDCSFAGGNVNLNTLYEDPAGSVYHPTDFVFKTVFNEPQIEVNITRADEPIDVSDLVEWTIEVKNTANYSLPLVWVQADLGDAFSYDSSVGDSLLGMDSGTNTGQMVTWEIQNIAPNQTASLTLRAVSDAAPCNPDLETSVSAWWGLGTSDGSSTTKPGVNVPDNTLCLNTQAFEDSRTETRQPVIQFASLLFNPATVSYYGESTQVQVIVQNNGPVDSLDTDMVITLPTGITYNAGTSTSSIGVDASLGTSAIGDPSLSGNTLTYFDVTDKSYDLFNVIQAVGGNDTGVLEFTVEAACPLPQSELNFVYKYYDACEDTQYSTTASASLTALTPELTVSQTFPEFLTAGINASGVIQITNSGTAAGGSSTNEHFIVSEILPSGVVYFPGSTKWRLDGGEWHGPSAEYNPTISGSTLEWTEQQLITLDLLPPDSILEISFEIASDNTFSGGDLKASAELEVQNQTCSITSAEHSHTLNPSPAAEVSIISITPAETVVGEAYTVQVSVSGSQGTPSGIVAVNDGSASCSFTLTNGSGSCSLTSTTAGVKTITVVYAGDSANAGSSTTQTHTVHPADTTTTITSVNTSPALVGEAYTVNFTVQSVLPGTLTPTGGNVTITDGTGANCTATLLNGSGSCSLASTSSGEKTLVASYPGSGDFNPSSSSGTQHQVNPADTVVTISAISPEPSAKDSLYNIAVSVAAALPSTAVPAGTVLVDDGEGNSCSITLSGGSGSCNLLAATSGSKTITAAFNASSDFNSSSVSKNHVVASLPEQLLLSRASVSTLQTLVGTLSTNGGLAPFTYSLETSGAACNPVNSSGNTSFSINNNQLERQPSTAAGEYPVCIQVSDALGSTFQKTFTLKVSEPPNNLALNGSQVSTDEQIVGLFSVNGGQAPLTYSLQTSGSTCDAANSTGNIYFSILDRALLRNSTTPAGVYPICVQAADQNGESIQQSFSITVENASTPPVLSPRISLSGSTLIDGDGSGTVVGTFTSTLEGTVFTLIDGTVLTDTALFSITNDQLVFHGHADRITQSVYLLRAMGTAPNNLTDTLEILVSVKRNGLQVGAFGQPDLVEVLSGQTFRVDVTANDTWSEGASAWSTLEIVSLPLHGIAVVGSIIYTANDGYTGSDEVVYRACDDLDYCFESNVVFTVLPKPDIEDFPLLPQTGFPLGVLTETDPPSQSPYFGLGQALDGGLSGLNLAHSADMQLEIPRLNLNTSVVGVPLEKDGWNVSWLGDGAGWLEGSAFPTLPGNSVLTAHVVDANGQPGPFMDLSSLRWGDKIIIRAWGETYIYQVRSVEKVKPDQGGIFAQEEQPWLTLLTCAGYDEDQAAYRYRIVVRAVLERVE